MRRTAPSPDVTGPALAPVDPRGAVEEAVQVETAESELRRLGLDDLRVHHHGDLARIEAPSTDLLAVTSEPLRGEVLRAVRSAGFRLVALDLAGPPDPGA
ncbi:MULTISPECIES: hypothetical protein [Cellulosimicrobium]|jgi:PP-loop superfamily ATP-utilizing enzyme|uniref:hypothetical protein n=1 Tax=Cellulosimicrobium TaxID=157920 RepID=UPI00117860CB|nr:MULTISPECIES: hypothetical protein [unclassified Cellulosimicrobium]MDQ8041078.1 hypothetical protein [Cellulosimicrobium sp. XJ-DQ-B-000]